MTSEERLIALIVHSNRITANRVKSILGQRGWKSEICDDGDKAVDEYVRLKPDMVFMGLNLPTLDGHIAALEMRESDPEARIVFVVSKARKAKADDAAFSAGAVAVLTTPLTRSDLDQNWVVINGPIPDAPGLADLDELYPQLEPEEPKLPALPEIPQPEEILTPMEKKPPNKTRIIPIIGILLIIAAGIFGTVFYLGIVHI